MSDQVTGSRPSVIIHVDPELTAEQASELEARFREAMAAQPVPAWSTPRQDATRERQRLAALVQATCACQPCKDGVTRLLSGDT